MTKRKWISFTARKTVTKPVKVSFKTYDGKKVSFTARKTLLNQLKWNLKQENDNLFRH